MNVIMNFYYEVLAVHMLKAKVLRQSLLLLERTALVRKDNALYTSMERYTSTGCLLDFVR